MVRGFVPNIDPLRNLPAVRNGPCPPGLIQCRAPDGAIMPQASSYEEWRAALKDQIEALRHQSESEPAIDEIFDTEIRRRFGEMIARSAASRRGQE
jgi:hypothetical protein